MNYFLLLFVLSDTSLMCFQVVVHAASLSVLTEAMMGVVGNTTTERCVRIESGLFHAANQQKGLRLNFKLDIKTESRLHVRRSSIHQSEVADISKTTKTTRICNNILAIDIHHEI